ncbi:adenylosuccinate lyase [Fervidicoccus fontis Kam940]|uniref:Adenylosuccinate lyase n=2 Tax=Fervidicoccaceae TaxID=685949 RepID=I0A0Q0_FERFK|nr:adenylosuccinate lyase [Fervidicoccus fontis Kam940]
MREMNKDVICVFDWRYGSDEMREIFSLKNIVKTYIKVENALMNGLIDAGFAPPACRDSVVKCGGNISPEEVYEKEKVLGHDIASLTYILGEVCGECGKYVHLGATSYDIVDTTWSLLIKQADDVLISKLKKIIEKLIELAKNYANYVEPGRTHGQHADPITFGFKFANYIYELTRSLERIKDAEKRTVKIKMSGAVGTMAAWNGKGLEIEESVSKQLNIEPHLISTQVAPRDGLAEVISSLAILASQLDRFALEVRELSRTEINEMYEYAERIGSSTMPHKRNPVTAERISGLAKIMRAFVISTLENIPLMHERDLTNSSSERVILPHAYLTMDQMMDDMIKLLNTLYINTEAAKKNLEITKGATLSEKLMLLLVERGFARHEAHKKVMQISRALKEGESLIDAALRDEDISKLFTREELERELKPEKYLGNYRELIERTISYAEKRLHEL